MIKTSKKRANKRQRRNNIWGFLFAAPFIIGFCLFRIIPFFHSLYLSFTDYSILAKPNWVGLRNYIKMFTDDQIFWMAFGITWKYSLVNVPSMLIISLLVAVLLSRKTKLTGMYRLAFYIPSLLGGSVAVAMTWKILWNSKGTVNQILQKMGLPTVEWLHNPRIAIYMLVLLSVWQFGSQMLIFLAGIKDVPVTLHEAAIMDGASPAKRFFFVTLPMITPTIFFNLVNGIIGSLQSFNSAFLVTAGGPLNSTLFYGLHQYRNAFEYLKMGYASAMAWFMMVVIVALTALVFRSQSAWVYYQGEK